MTIHNRLGKDTAASGESTSELAAAVAAMGALPVPLGHAEPVPQSLEDQLTGVRLSLWEEEQDAKRARFAAKLARQRAVKLRAQVAELEEQGERRRLRLIALQNDALNMRGSLSPNDEKRKVPFPLGETLTPAVDWLIARVAELEARPSHAEVLVEAADDLVAACPEHSDADECWMDCPCEYADELRRRAALVGGAVAPPGAECDDCDSLSAACGHCPKCDVCLDCGQCCGGNGCRCRCSAGGA